MLKKPTTHNIQTSQHDLTKLVEQAYIRLLGHESQKCKQTTLIKFVKLGIMLKNPKREKMVLHIVTSMVAKVGKCLCT